MRGLLIAEKPSQMRAIQEVYENHKSQFNYDIDFTCQRGHLLTLKLPDELDESMKQKTWDNLPFFPKQWEYKVIEKNGIRRSGKRLNPADMTLLFIPVTRIRKGNCW